MAKKNVKSKYSRPQNRQQRIVLILTAVIAVIMVLSMIISMLPPAPALALPILLW